MGQYRNMVWRRAPGHIQDRHASKTLQEQRRTGRWLWLGFGDVSCHLFAVVFSLTQYTSPGTTKRKQSIALYTKRSSSSYHDWRHFFLSMETVIQRCYTNSLKRFVARIYPMNHDTTNSYRTDTERLQHRTLRYVKAYQSIYRYISGLGVCTHQNWYKMDKKIFAWFKPPTTRPTPYPGQARRRMGRGSWIVRSIDPLTLTSDNTHTA